MYIFKLFLTLFMLNDNSKNLIKMLHGVKNIYLVLSHKLVETWSPFMPLYSLITTFVSAGALLRAALCVDHSVNAIFSTALPFLPFHFATAGLGFIQQHRFHIIVDI